MRLLAFPCARELVAPFCARAGTEGSAALILRKQEPALREELLSCGIGEIITLPEEFYGRVSSQETRDILTGIHARSIAQACFPMNDFCGNVALLLSVLAQSVTAINPTARERFEARMPGEEVCAVPRAAAKTRWSEVQTEIVERLKAFAPQLAAMALGDHAGERPTGGIIANFPYDCEVLARYAHAARQLSGQALEIGCGLGFGAFAMVELNPHLRVHAVDSDREAVAMARALWAGHDRLIFKAADARKLPFAASSFDAIVCFEVIEHLDAPREFLATSRQLLADGGVLIGSTPNWRLFPYRANRTRSAPPDALREKGIWPWHIHEFDEAAVLHMMGEAGFGAPRIGYPTFITGAELLNRMRRMPFVDALEALSRLDWSAGDFDVLDRYVPCFSGFSFTFSGTKQPRC